MNTEINDSRSEGYANGYSAAIDAFMAVKEGTVLMSAAVDLAHALMESDDEDAEYAGGYYVGMIYSLLVLTEPGLSV